MIPLDRLIVIAAPSCCGKSTFIRRIRSGKYENIVSALNMGDVTDWKYVDAFYINAKTLANIEQSPTNKLVVHWTVPRPSLKVTIRNLLLLNAYDKKARLKLLQSAREITIVTLYTSQQNLIKHVSFRRERIHERRGEGKESVFSFLRKTWNTGRIERHYSDAGNLVTMYEQWFRFCRTLNPHAEFLVDLEDEPEIECASNWPAVRKRWLDDDQ